MKKTLQALLAAGLLVTSAAADAQSLTYGLSVTNAAAAPTLFSYTFSVPITPLAGLVNYSFSGFLRLTDASGNGVSASPGSSGEFWLLEVWNGSSSSIVDVVGGTSVLNGAATFPFASSGTFDCSAIGSCNTLSIKTSFALTGGGDQATSEGEFTLQPAAVPEPATLALIGFGLVGLARVGARRTRQMTLPE